jgi:hypothetical protein
MSDKYRLNNTNIESLDLDFYLEIVKDVSRIRDIEDDLTTLTADYSYYYGMMNRAKALQDKALYDLETLQSVLKTEKRKLAIGKKLTVDALNDEVKAMQCVIDQENLLTKLCTAYGYAKGICSTLDHKKDMLIQLSANRRMETKLHA